MSNLRILFWVNILNYLAQIPYYLHNYYFPYHTPPSSSAVVLLGVTFVWFLAGYIGTKRRNRYGYFLLLSFLLVESLFYFHTIIFGAFIFQLQNPSVLIKSVFLIGYLSGITAAYYVYVLIRHRKRCFDTQIA